MIPAQLPGDLRAHRIMDLDPGEEAYATPWTMTMDSRGRCWIDTRQAISMEPTGQSNMRVWREEGGWAVDVSKCGEFKWPHNPDARGEPVVRVQR